MVDPSPDETRQLEELRARLRREYPDRAASNVDAAVDQGIAELADAKIRNFVPVLVERSARRHLDG
ncbi:three-helix bundle dimerization domain-containing protein [Curtobacterium sp. RRHDQ66]|uniref:three-helix bundle dimerization domain-containing protein n=1 Tax=Curtobacterium TaxID=2034 RepID=UPI000B04AE9F|nr:hypothetical protein [Curtobacterium oceanosedimentum]